MDLLKHILLTFFIILSLVAWSQQANEIKPNVLMLKIKPEYKSMIQNGSIWNKDLNEVLGLLQNANLRQVFPKHSNTKDAPESSNRLQRVDLSLWFQLDYISPIPSTNLQGYMLSVGIFEVVEPRPLSTLLWYPNDPLKGNQFYLNKIKAYAAWDIETGSSSVVVGITDTGIDKIHEDLKDALYYSSTDTLDGLDNDNDGYIDNYCGWDLGNNDNNPQWGIYGHGTFVSGFVGAVPNNAKGIAGVGYHTKILPIRIDDSLGFLDNDYESIVYAADHGAQIINCSWGGTFGSVFGHEIVKYATYNRNALVVAACGNSNNDVWLFPASYPEVLSVAATDSLDQRWEYSSYGSRVDLAAPGTYVYSTWVGNAYISSHGTSFSAPIVAGAAALVKSHFPNYSALQIAEQLRISCDPIDTFAANQPYAEQLGSGRLNVLRALTDTLSPSIRLENFSYFQQNDTLFIGGSFINYLHPSSDSLKVRINAQSLFLSPILDSAHLGSLHGMGSTANLQNWFSFKIMPAMPLDFTADLKLEWIDTAYTGFEMLRVKIKPVQALLDTNLIQTSVTSLGTLGFTNLSQETGTGFSFRQGENLLYFGGLLIGNSATKISNNLMAVNSEETDFIPLSEAEALPSTTEIHQSWFNKYNDNGALGASLKVEVNQYSFASNTDSLKKSVFLKYRIRNTYNQPLSNVYVGLYADWELRKPYANRANTDMDLNLAYCYSDLGGAYVGMQLLSSWPFFSYQFNNSGADGSINIYDGFINSEKWAAITTNRLQAGMQGYGNDVSSMISSGPFSINPGDTLELNFALLAGDYLSDLKHQAQNNWDWFFNTASVPTQQYTSSRFNLSHPIPNPAQDLVNFEYFTSQDETLTFELFDAQGRQVATLFKSTVRAGSHEVNFNLQDFKSGVYLLKMTNSEGQYRSQRLIIQP